MISGILLALKEKENLSKLTTSDDLYEDLSLIFENLAINNPDQKKII